MSEITIRNSIQASLQGLVSRGIKACRKDDDGHLIFTLTDNSEVDIGKVDGDDGVSITGISTQTTPASGAPNIVTITLSNGTTTTFNVRNGVPGHTPVKGTDYFTSAEISQMETDIRNSITIPTKTSDLTNDSLYISEGGDISDLSNDVGYLTSETDPVFSASPANTIAYSDINAWNGKYTKPNSGILKTDLESSVQTSLGKADTALQSETDPTVPSWAKQTSKPTYEANEIGYGDSNIGAAIGDIEEEIGTLNEDLSFAASDATGQRILELVEESLGGYSSLVDLVIKLPQDSAGQEVLGKLTTEISILSNILISLEEGMRHGYID